MNISSYTVHSYKFKIFEVGLKFLIVNKKAAFAGSLHMTNLFTGCINFLFNVGEKVKVFLFCLENVTLCVVNLYAWHNYFILGGQYRKTV